MQKSLPRSLTYIIKELSALTCALPHEIIQIVQKARVQVEDLLPWADFDHPIEDSYGRQLVYMGLNFEVMVMSWKSGDFSAIHDHGQTQWGAVQVFGSAEHATFAIREGELVTLSRMQMEAGTIVGVNKQLIHQMGNANPDGTFLSLHVYGNAGETESITGDARIFEPDRGEIYRVDGGVFYHLPEEQIKVVESGPFGDSPTRIRHLKDLYRRMAKIQSAGGPVSSKQLIQVANRLAFLEGTRSQTKPSEQ